MKTLEKDLCSKKEKTSLKYGGDSKLIPFVLSPRQYLSLIHTFLSLWHHVVFPNKHSRINTSLKTFTSEGFCILFDSKSTDVWNIQVQAWPPGQG